MLRSNRRSTMPPKTTTASTTTMVPNRAIRARMGRARSSLCDIRAVLPSDLPQRVPDAADGVDEPVVSSLLQLRADIADVDVDRVAGCAETVAPHHVQYPVSGQHLARIAQEELHQVELAGRQV